MIMLEVKVRSHAEEVMVAVKNNIPHAHVMMFPMSASHCVFIKYDVNKLTTDEVGFIKHFTSALNLK